MRQSSSPVAEIIAGALITIILNVGVIIALIIIGNFIGSLYMPLSSIAFVATFIGLAQLVYIVPICIYLKRRGQSNWMKGIIIGACITALINGGCWFFLAGAGIGR